MGGSRGIIFGIKRGQVVDNIDPENRNRVKVKVPGLHEDDTPATSLPWAGVMYIGTGQGQGKLQAPKIGVSVVLQFVEGDPDHPMVMGEWPTTLDVANTSKDEYTAGDEVSIVEGNEDKKIFGDTSESVQLNKRVSVGRNFIQEDRNHAESSTGQRVIVAGTEEITTYGAATKNIEGPYNILGGSSLSLASILSTSITAGQKIELLSLAGQINLVSALLGVNLQAGLLGYITISPTGQIFMGTNLTTAALLRPVTTIEHVHIGNLGLITSPALPNPATLGGISTKVLIE